MNKTISATILFFIFLCGPAFGIDWQAAQRTVQNLPCSKGGTVEQCLNKKARKSVVDDLGWIVVPTGSGYDVERLMLLNGTMKLSYKWQVSHGGKVTTVNGKAIGITRRN